jgi:hypothetical protein
MHACAVLQRILRPVIARLDARNARNLFLAVEALVRGRRLTLMELARHWPGAERVRAPLKRLDRLLGNVAMQAARTDIYKTAIRSLLCGPRPVLIVDWSELKSDGRWHLLRAGLAAKGRTLTVYEEVHPEAKKHNRQVQTAFLRRLQKLLPPDAHPILVTDAGFRVPWFRAVEAMGWHWVGRVRDRARVRRLDSAGTRAWFPCKTLYAQASTRAHSLGRFVLTQSNPLAVRLVLVRRRKRGRIERTRHGQPARGGRSLKQSRRAKDPWLLACSCSLDALSPAEIVTLYARRMQIEQSFRDLKSHRFGCAFEDTLTRTSPRLEMLLLIHALAALAAWLAGLAAISANVAHWLKPGPSARYSVLWMGWAMLRHHGIRWCGPLISTIAPLREMLARAA